jgi:hypothetical protein
MIQSGHGPGFSVEAFGELRRRNLDRDVPPEPWIAGQVHFAHAPSPNETEDFVGTELVARRERHDWERFYSNGGTSYLGVQYGRD